MDLLGANQWPSRPHSSKPAASPRKGKGQRVHQEESYMTLTQKIALVKAQREPKLVPVRMSPFVRRLNAKQLPVRVIGGIRLNGAWTPNGSGGAA